MHVGTVGLYRISERLWWVGVVDPLSTPVLVGGWYSDHTASGTEGILPHQMPVWVGQIPQAFRPGKVGFSLGVPNHSPVLRPPFIGGRPVPTRLLVSHSWWRRSPPWWWTQRMPSVCP